MFRGNTGDLFRLFGLELWFFRYSFFSGGSSPSLPLCVPYGGGGGGVGGGDGLFLADTDVDVDPVPGSGGTGVPVARGSPAKLTALRRLAVSMAVGTPSAGAAAAAAATGAVDVGSFYANTQSVPLAPLLMRERRRGWSAGTGFFFFLGGGGGFGRSISEWPIGRRDVPLSDRFGLSPRW